MNAEIVFACCNNCSCLSWLWKEPALYLEIKMKMMISFCILTFCWLFQPMAREYQNGDGFGYILAFRKKDASSWTVVRVPLVESSRYVYYNDSLTPYSPFEVKIKAYNRRGEGPFSQIAVVHSAEEGESLWNKWSFQRTNHFDGIIIYEMMQFRAKNFNSPHLCRLPLLCCCSFLVRQLVFKKITTTVSHLDWVFPAENSILPCKWKPDRVHYVIL